MSSNAKLAKPFTTAQEMADYVQSGEVDMVDCCFTDAIGIWHHCTFAPSLFQKEDIEDGLPFDGSSIRLFTNIEESDMSMMPDVTTCWIDPFYEKKVLHVTCSIHRPDQPTVGFRRDPRTICKKALEYMVSTGIADTAYFGPEPEFFIFDEVRYCCKPNKVAFEINGAEAPWNSDSVAGGPNLGHRLNHKQYYFPVNPIDTDHNLRSDMLMTMGAIGLPIEKHHHEVAACQSELGIAFKTMVESADSVMCYKYVVKNVAHKHGKTATFMPKPMYGDNGSGMHVHQSLWKDGKALFFDANGKYQKLSDMCMHYIGGLLNHAPAVLAFTNPTVNSYKRLVPGFEAPVNLVLASGNRSACVRIPMHRPDNPKAKRLEFRCPDPACCPYLAYAAMLMAGLDGIQNAMSPGEPCDVDIFEMTSEEKKRRNLRSTPGTLLEVVEALERDHAFLRKGDVFPQDFINAYIAYKRAECLSVATVPHPKEFELYYAC